MYIALGLVLAMVVVGYFVLKASEEKKKPLPLVRPPSRAPGAEPKENWLVGVGGEVDGKSFLIGARILTIGRTPQNAIQITDAEASRQHCQVKAHANGLSIVDMNSSNKTFINDQVVINGQMNEGDELRIGEARFVYKKRHDAANDDRLAGKVGGAPMLKSTAQAQNSPMLYDLVQKTHGEMQGDVDRTAKKLGVAPEIVRRILEDRTSAPN
jgi:hypothetical protein